MKITYYTEIVSHWCLRAEKTWADLKVRYKGRVEFNWKIAWMRPEDFPKSLEEDAWYIKRGDAVTQTVTGYRADWFDAARRGDYTAPGLVAEAARDLGFEDDTIRLALARAALLEGRKIGDMGESVAIAARVGKLDAVKLRTRAESAVVRGRIRSATSEFHALQVTQRPAFLIEDRISDRAVFSGLIQYAPLAATIDAMLSDTAGYAGFAAEHGEPPAS